MDRDQLQGETNEEYIRVLVKLLESCDYEEPGKSDMLRDKLLNGIRDRELAQKLRELGKDCTANKVKARLREVEQARIEEKMRKLDKGESSVSKVEAVEATANGKNKWAKWREPQQREYGGRGKFNVKANYESVLRQGPSCYGNNDAGGWRGQGDQQQRKLDSCYRCGMEPHPERECPNGRFRCWKCGGNDHYSSYCRNNKNVTELVADNLDEAEGGNFEDVFEINAVSASNNLEVDIKVEDFIELPSAANDVNVGEVEQELESLETKQLQIDKGRQNWEKCEQKFKTLEQEILELKAQIGTSRAEVVTTEKNHKKMEEEISDGKTALEEAKIRIWHLQEEVHRQKEIINDRNCEMNTNANREDRDMAKFKLEEKSLACKLLEEHYQRVEHEALLIQLGAAEDLQHAEEKPVTELQKRVRRPKRPRQCPLRGRRCAWLVCRNSRDKKRPQDWRTWGGWWNWLSWRCSGLPGGAPSMLITNRKCADMSARDAQKFGGSGESGGASAGDEAHPCG